MSALEAALAVITVREGAKTRIFIDTSLTFFSEHDEWLYVEISDDKLCPTCNANSRMEDGIYRGHRIRGFFPYLEILDENTIKVNEHPNCRCVLTRLAKTVELPKKMVDVEP